MLTKINRGLFSLNITVYKLQTFFLSPPSFLAHEKRIITVFSRGHMINCCKLGTPSLQWLTCASSKLAKQTHDNCDKHGVIYEMPLLKCLATRNIPSSTIWGYHKYWKFSHSETSWTHRMTNFWDSIQKELRGFTKRRKESWFLLFFCAGCYLLQECW